jgi:hypothetical protein
MHQLIPDELRFVDPSTGEEEGNLDLPELLRGDGEQVLRKYGLRDVLYSFAIANAGAVTLRNFPKHLRELPVEGADPIDLAAVDILRTRSRGVPRYNDFRITRVYGSVDEIDTVVGLLAETPPEGFGFSDTAFRIFLLMASRRLRSDRFLTVDFTSDVYTPLGMDWIARTSFSSLLERHHPDLAGVIPAGKDVFAPWQR